MLFTKSLVVFSSFLAAAVQVLAAPVAMPMPAAKVVSLHMRNVKLIQAYAKRQDPGIVNVSDSIPFKAPDGGDPVPYKKRQNTGIVTSNDNEAAQAPDGVLVPYPKRQDTSGIVEVSDSIPFKAPDGIPVPYTKRQDPGIVEVSDSIPFKAPDGIPVPYTKRSSQNADISGTLRMRRTRSTRAHA